MNNGHRKMCSLRIQSHSISAVVLDDKDSGAHKQMLYGY